MNVSCFPLVAALAVCTFLGAGCGGADGDQLTVMAASSLTDVFEELTTAFEATETGEGTEVVLVLAGSSRLATQLEEGAPADVVATADEASMARIESSGRLAAMPQIFASNSLVVVQEAGAEPVSSLGELADPDALVAMCAEQVPCGRLTTTFLAEAGVSIQPATREPNVRSVLTKVVLGEVDAGFVYTTDAIASSADLTTFTPPGAAEVVNLYPIATLNSDPVAAAFVTFVLSEGQTVLQRYGFGQAPR